MIQLKKVKKAIALAFVLAFTAPIVTPYTGGMAVVEAATIKINKTKETLVVGKTITLKVEGTKGKAVWSSSKPSVAVVNKSTGKVTAKKVGTATITGTIGTKKYTCKITVKNFLDQKITVDKVSFNIPKAWTANDISANGIVSVVTYPKNADLDTTSGITILTYDSGIPMPDMASVKEYYKTAVTEETQKAAVSAQLGTEVSISGLKTTFAEKYDGILAVTSFVATQKDGSRIKFSANELWKDSRLLSISIVDMSTKITPSLAKVKDHILKTFHVES